MVDLRLVRVSVQPMALHTHSLAVLDAVKYPAVDVIKRMVHLTRLLYSADFTVRILTQQGLFENKILILHHIFLVRM